METPKCLIPALRQYQHNGCSGLVFGFDCDETIKVITELEGKLEKYESINIEELHNVRRQLERSLKQAQNNNDMNYVDGFDHCLQLLGRAGIKQLKE